MRRWVRNAEGVPWTYDGDTLPNGSVLWVPILHDWIFSNESRMPGVISDFDREMKFEVIWGDETVEQIEWDKITLHEVQHDTYHIHPIWEAKPSSFYVPAMDSVRIAIQGKRALNCMWNKWSDSLVEELFEA